MQHIKKMSFVLKNAQIFHVFSVENEDKTLFVTDVKVISVN